jgi:ribosomal protein S18 acetylase RimI-like enzyme
MLKHLFFMSMLLAQSINSCDVFKDGKQFHRLKAGSPIYLEVGSIKTDEDFDVTDETKEIAIQRMLEKHPRFESIVHTAKFREMFAERFRKGFKIKTVESGAEVGYAAIVDAGEKLAVTLFAINEPYRRKGYAKQAILTIEGIVKAHKGKWPGVNLIFFHVNAENTAMISLLSKLGYEESLSGGAIHFTKPIPA